MSINVRTESNGDSHQITIQGLLQMTVCANGEILIDLAGKAIEVDRDMPNSRMTIRRNPRYAFMAPEVMDTLIDGME